MRPRYGLIILVAVLSLGSVLGTPRMAQAQPGIAAGANFDRLGDLDLSGARATFDNATGYHVGLFYDLAIGPLAVRPGIFYVDVGQFDVNYDTAQDCTSAETCLENVDLTMIEAPLDLRFRLSTPLVKPYVLAGPVFQFASSDNEAVDNSLEDISVAGNVGAGIEFGLPGGGLRLFPEIRYSFGVTRLVKDFEYLGADFSAADDNQRLHSFMLRLGVSF